MPHMQNTGNVRRRNDYDKGFCISLDRCKQIILHPVVINTIFKLFGIVGFFQLNRFHHSSPYMYIRFKQDTTKIAATEQHIELLYRNLIGSTSVEGCVILYFYAVFKLLLLLQKAPI